ncbi:MAG: hypothetical protein ACE5KE_01505 [Methanosarcinales archaeon]
MNFVRDLSLAEKAGVSCAIQRFRKETGYTGDLNPLEYTGPVEGVVTYVYEFDNKQLLIDIGESGEIGYRVRNS